MATDLKGILYLITAVLDYETRIARLEQLMENTAESLAGMCEAIDGQQTTSSGTTTYHCCINRHYNKMYCATTTIATAIGISTSNGENTCDSSNSATFCKDDTDITPIS